MGKEDVIQMSGIVREVLPGTKFKVELLNYEGKPIEKEIFATISGKLRLNSIKILRGDRVDVEISVYDFTNGRIIWRYK